MALITVSSVLRHTIKVWLVENHHTQDWLAHELGLDYSYFSRILHGLRKPPQHFNSNLQVVTGIKARLEEIDPAAPRQRRKPGEPLPDLRLKTAANKAGAA